MKFTKIVSLYRINDDNSVTIKYQEDDNEPIFYRCNARLHILLELSKLEVGTLLDATFGLGYVKGKGLALQIIKYTI